MGPLPGHVHAQVPGNGVEGGDGLPLLLPGVVLQPAKEGLLHHVFGGLDVLTLKVAVPVQFVILGLQVHGGIAPFHPV